MSRDSIFKFIEAELNGDAHAACRQRGPPASTGASRSGAADAILASLYLNAGVFNKDTGSMRLAYNTCNGRRGGDGCQAHHRGGPRDQLRACTRWRPTGKSNFSPDNDDSPENIFVIAHTDA